MTIITRSRYEADLAAAAIRLFERGNRTPRTAQLAREHFKGTTYSVATVSDVRRRLRRIKALLDSEFQLDVVLVGPGCYQILREGGPVTQAEAWRCLPVGRGNSADGIHLCTPPNDLIYQAAIHLSLIQAAGKESVNLSRIVRAAGTGNVTGEWVGVIVEELDERRLPVDPGGLDRILGGGLPAINGGESA